MPPKVGVQCTFARSVSYRVAAATVTTTAPIEQDKNVTEIVEPTDRFRGDYCLLLVQSV